MITQKRLKEVLHYNQDTGLFIWIVAKSDKTHIGDVAGSKHNAGYIRIRIDKKLYLSHRLAFLYMTGKFPKYEVDHINHIRTDNRWGNLRAVTRQENCFNASMPRDNTSGVMGVSWAKKNKKWLANIRIDGKTKYIGLFEKIEDAITARKETEKLYGFHPNHGT